jgi:hypothetical protein
MLFLHSFSSIQIRDCSQNFSRTNEFNLKESLRVWTLFERNAAFS